MWMFPIVPGMMVPMSQDRAKAAQMVVTRRGEIGLTQIELAERAGVDIKTIYNIESGERWPQSRTRVKIERALGWVAGALDAFAEGRETGYQFPTRAELIADGLRRRGLAPNEAARLAGLSPDDWENLASGSATISDARIEDPAAAQLLARAALVVGLVPEQLADAGQHQASAFLRKLIQQALETPEESAAHPDPEFQRLLKLWPLTQEWQRRSIVAQLWYMADSPPELRPPDVPEAAPPQRKTPDEESRRTG